MKWTVGRQKFVHYIPYSLDRCELLNRTIFLIVEVAAASGLVQDFRIVLPQKMIIRNSKSSLYSSLFLTYEVLYIFTSWAIAPKLQIYFFSHSSPFFSNLQISAILLLFLNRMDGLLSKYDMMILFSEFLSGFRISCGFSGYF